MEDQNQLIAAALSWWTKDRKEKTFGKKHLTLDPVKAAPLLRVLALMNKDGSISPDKLKKFLQLSHMLQILEPKLQWVAKQNATVRLLDACCGTSFLGLTIAWYMQHHLQHPFEILGIDRNTAVIETSNARAASLGLQSSTKFLAADLTPHSWDEHYAIAFEKPLAKLQILVALHACDSATDVALALALAQKVNLVAVAPCCQAELNQQWILKPLPERHPLAGAISQPQVRRELAAQLTDSMRCLAIQAKGYEVTATEFVAASHTPKNRLILAERRGQYWEPARRSFEDLWTHLGSPDFALLEMLKTHSLWGTMETEKPS